MGHTKRTYERFGDDLVRPLYGYVTDLKDGHVPGWVKPHTMTQETKLAMLLDIEYDNDGEISASRLPSGITKETGGFGGVNRTKYVFDPEAWLQHLREKSADDFWANRALFDLRRDTTGRSYPNPTTGKPTLPDDIAERLAAITETPKWDEYYHHRTREDFRQWYLRYQFGNRGGIQSVHIVADSHH